MKIKKHIKNSSLVCSVIIALMGCAVPTAITKQAQSINTPLQWNNNHTDVVTEALVLDWLTTFNSDALEHIVTQALTGNYQLKAQRINVAIAKERLNVTNASDFPELSLALDNGRRKSVVNENTSYTNDANLSLKLRYELDLWGQLSDEQSQSQLNFAAAQANYNQQMLELIANVTRTWFNLIQAKKLLALYQERVTNQTKNLAIIQSSYQLGLSEALDVYLTQNEVNSELARVASQKQLVSEQTRQLELLVGEYPSAQINTDAALPMITEAIAVGLPSEILTNRQDIKAAWFNLLALNDGLAIAHKQRFPSFTINASSSDNKSRLEDLLSGSALAWSLIGNITTPLFNAGKLASLEEQARLAVVQQEQIYLETVYQAFAEVENGISNQHTLLQRYQYIQQAKINALTAEKLSFEQYMKGLVSYTTVLDAQRRAFDAQTSVIQLQNELLQNRISLYIALGGSALPMNSTGEPSTNELTQITNREL